MKKSKTVRSPEAKNKEHRIYCDGSGQRPDGKGSGFAFLEEYGGHKHVERIDGLTNNEAEYMSLRAAIEWLPEQSEAEILSDSDLMCSQFNGRYKVRDLKLRTLLEEVRGLIEKKKLRVRVGWIRREQNCADQLL